MAFIGRVGGDTFQAERLAHTGVFSFCARPRKPYTPEKKRKFVRPSGCRRAKIFAPYSRDAGRFTGTLFQIHAQHQRLTRGRTSKPHIILKVVDFPAPFGPANQRFHRV